MELPLLLGAQLIAYHVFYVGTGAIYRVFIEYFVFSKDFRTPALQQNWQRSEKSQNLKEKTQYLMNTLYDILRMALVRPRISNIL